MSRSHRDDTRGQIPQVTTEITDEDPMASSLREPLSAIHDQTSQTVPAIAFGDLSMIVWPDTGSFLARTRPQVTEDMHFNACPTTPHQHFPHASYSSIAASRQLNPTDHQTDPRRCVTCLCKKSKPRCDGWPLCREHGKAMQDVDLTQMADLLVDCWFLDPETWHEVLYCRPDLYAICAHIKKENAAMRCDKYLIVLGIGFDDILKQSIMIDRISVTLDCNLLAGRAWSNGYPSAQLLYEPAISITQLDQVVQRLVWGKLYAPDPDNELTQAENELLLTTQQLAGYLSLFDSLPTSQILMASYRDEGLRLLVATELVCTVMFKLNSLFTHFKILCRQIQQDNHGMPHVAVWSHCLETLLRMMQDCIDNRWQLDEIEKTHSFAFMYDSFISHLEYIHSLVGCYECYFTRTNIPASKGNIPSMLKLVRDWNKRECRKRLPKHCNIEVSRTDQLRWWLTPFVSHGMSCHIDNHIPAILRQRLGCPDVHQHPGMEAVPRYPPIHFLRPDRTIANNTQPIFATTEQNDGGDSENHNTSSCRPASPVINVASISEGTIVRATAPTLLWDESSDNTKEDEEIMRLIEAAAEDDDRDDDRGTRYYRTVHGYAMIKK